MLCGAVENHAELSIPAATGADGVFAPKNNTVIDLAKAQTGRWDSDPVWAGGGVYDPEKWVIVFKYAAVNIPEKVTVTFKNHPSRAPVVWLVATSAVIDGTIDLSGASLDLDLSDDPPSTYNEPPEPGPGGFRGGKAYDGTKGNEGSGYGPGGGQAGPGNGNSWSTWGRPADHATPAGPDADDVGVVYGNAQILPLLGGSGGGASQSRGNRAGGAGGGAMLIATADTISLNGAIKSHGGESWYTGGGSGGAVRLIAAQLEGSGTISAMGNSGRDGNGPQQDFIGGDGRIRLEAASYLGSLHCVPATQVVVPSEPVQLWPPATAPLVRIQSVGATDAPADPRANMGAAAADVSLIESGDTEVVIQSVNVPPVATMKLRITPRQGLATVITATFESGDFNEGLWKATANLKDGFSALQAYVEVP